MTASSCDLGVLIDLAEFAEPKAVKVTQMAQAGGGGYRK